MLRCQKDNHQSAANEALQVAGSEITSGRWDMIILDEINYAIKLGLVPLDAVFELIKIKHPYKKGIKAQQGIEF